MNKSLFNLLPTDIILKLLSTFDLEGLLVFLMINPLNLSRGAKIDVLSANMTELQIGHVVDSNGAKVGLRPQWHYFQDYYFRRGVKSNILCMRFRDFYVQLYTKLLHIEKFRYAYDLIKLLFNFDYVMEYPINELYDQMQQVQIIEFVKSSIESNDIYKIITYNLCGYLKIIIFHESKFCPIINFDDVYVVDRQENYYKNIHSRVPESSDKYVPRSSNNDEFIDDFDDEFIDDFNTDKWDPYEDWKNVIMPHPRSRRRRKFSRVISDEKVTYCKINFHVFLHLHMCYKLGMLNEFIQTAKMNNYKFLLTGLDEYCQEVDDNESMIELELALGELRCWGLDIVSIYCVEIYNIK